MGRIYSKMVDIANYAAMIPSIKKILKPLYYPIKKYIEKSNNKRFNKNALKVLEEFTSCLELNNIQYTLAFGTLLGAIREKGFIKHDLDIDIAMWIDERPDNLTTLLSDAGFSLLHSFSVENGKLGLEETYTKSGVSIDIFYFFPAINEYPYCCDFLGIEKNLTHAVSMKKFGRVLARRIELPMSRDRMMMDFENLKLYVPVNSNELLEYRYGYDYMIPNENWGITSFDNHIIEWPEVSAKFIR